MAAKPLTKAEREWVNKVQAVLNQCPSDRLGAYFSGSFDLSLFDASYEKEIDEMQTRKDCEIGSAVAELGADLGQLDFPFVIQHG